MIRHLNKESCGLVGYALIDGETSSSVGEEEEEVDDEDQAQAGEGKQANDRL